MSRTSEHAAAPPSPRSYLRWIPLLPLLGAVVNGLGGALIQRRFGKRAIAALAVRAGRRWRSCSSVAAFFQLRRARRPSSRLLLDRRRAVDRTSATLHADIAFALDPLSAVMILVVTGIGGLIHLYSTGYMHDDAVVLALLRAT